MNARLEELLVVSRNALGENSVVYHLETQLFVLPAIQVPYERDSKNLYLIGRHWEVYAPDERRPRVRMMRAWVRPKAFLKPGETEILLQDARHGHF